MVKEIITRVVVDIASGRILEKKSFEYRGEIAECKGGGQPTSMSTTELPAWLQPYASQFIQAYQNQAFDENGELTAQPGDLKQNLAGFNEFQTQGFNNIANMTDPMQQYANLGVGQSANTIAGAYLNPDTNPYIGATYDRAARKLTDAYSTATAPSIMASAQQSGNFGGSAMDQALRMSQYGLGENLADLGTSIYGGNYANERSNQLNTMAQLPNTLNAAYTPQQSLLGVGAQWQQQDQSQYDTNYANALNRTQYPYEILSGFGGALGQAGMGAGQSTTKAGGSGGGGMMGSIICTTLHDFGLMDDATFEADTKFGESLPPEVIRGYHLWAIPVARWMHKSFIVTALIEPIALSWALTMRARIEGKPENETWLGRQLLRFGVPLCGWLGRRREAWATQT